MKKIILIGLFLGMLFSSQRCFSQQEPQEEGQKKAAVDSLIDSYSVEDILKYREYYQKQIENITAEKVELRKKGIRDAEKFLENNPNSKVLDKVMMRLAELYYEDAEEEFIQQMQAYDLKLEELGDAPADTTLTEPVKNYSKALGLYQIIIDEYQHSELLDDALYNKAFILEETGKIQEALTIYNSIIAEFQDSRYVPECLMRIAEYYFNPPKNDIDTAIDYYKKILEYKDSPKYDEALYRLGWCYYRKSDYPLAVSYFTILADDVQRAGEIDPEQKFSNPVLRDESIEYIGISFLDYGGTDRAVDYLNSIGGRDYGVDILKKIGDVYLNEKEMYDQAVQAYQTLLKMYPEDKEAPFIQDKIVLCYRHQNDDMMAYVARDKLFNHYKPGSPWWQNQQDETMKEKVYGITERSLRDNINLLFQRAEAANDQDLYLQAVNDSRKYLKSFASDSSAPQIHWNMALTLDTKLHQTDEAFEEYMKISDLYWGSKYQKYSAENSIALAKDAVETDTSKKQIASGETVADLQKKASSVLEALDYDRMEFSEYEKKLLRAYNNYIKLFPHEPETATILANAGALNYNNNRFPEALRYFNTIIKHFPDSKDVDYAKYTIMESYFGKRDFKSAEIIARNLKNTEGIDASLADKAKNRLAESIFLAAEVFADSADHLQAGNEYLRVVMEVPNAEFADLSVFNAALEYDKAKEFSRAVETYNYLIETRPNSKYLLDAMNNLAIDYGELKEFKNAALTYERLANAAKDSARTHDALFNSSLFFVKAEEWEDAIRINRQFVQKYPKSQDADDLFYDIATYYLKLDDLDKANSLYGEYAQLYPNSPRVIETYFHRGEYYRNKDLQALAKGEYEKAVAKNTEFKSKNLEQNDYFAAEALFQLTLLHFGEFKAIEFQLPVAKMEQSKSQKRGLLIKVVDGFTQVATFGTLRLYEATFYIGETYDEFARCWVRQEIPQMDETRRIVTQKEINKTTADLYEKAEESYKQAVRILSRLADEYEQSLMTDSTALAENELTKVVREDSTLRVARKWIDRSKEKISEVIYDIAELNFTSVNGFLEAPIPEGLDNVAEMEYRKQVLSKAIAPLIQEIVDAHVRNVREGWNLGLENQWVKLSRRKILTTSNLLASEYYSLAEKSLRLYRESSENYIKTTQQGGSAEGLDATTLSDQMANLIDFTRAFSAVTVEMYRKTLERAVEENINDPSVSETKEIMLKDLYTISQECSELEKTCRNNRKNYEKQFKETDKIEYEDALFTYEDNYFAFREANKELLELGYQIAQDMEISNQWVPKIVLALVQANPEEYGNLLNLEASTTQHATNDSWKATTQYTEGWTQLEFNDIDWYTVQQKSGVFQNAGEADVVWLSEVDTTGVEYDTTVVTVPVMTDTSLNAEVLPDSSLSDSSRLANETKYVVTTRHCMENIPARRVFFRKKFSVTGLPVSADIKIKVDDSYNLFLNGEYVAAFAQEDTMSVDQEHFHELTEILVEGDNVLAIEGIDNNATGGGLVAAVSVKALPEWNDKKQQIQIETSDIKIKKNLVMDKYIIMY
ncbi:MAG: tetratricopeptide repeat protein [Candidatus Zhuqueibacterota bacterium]